jgi:hypothetical protein
MKSTAERFRESYCTAKSEDETHAVNEASRENKGWCVYEWEGKWAYFEGEDGDEYIEDGSIKDELSCRTEITVPHFTDLLRDTIAPWRLAEDGFKAYADGHMYNINVHTDLHIGAYGIYIRARDAGEEVEIDLNNIKTYTDLLTLIRLIG